MNHDQYVDSVRKRIGRIARDMIKGTKDYLEGAIEISSLCHEAEVDINSKEFIVFRGISSDVDHLPIGEVRNKWSKEALLKHEPEIQQSTLWAKEISLEQCNLLAKKYGT